MLETALNFQIRTNADIHEATEIVSGFGPTGLGLSRIGHRLSDGNHVDAIR